MSRVTDRKLGRRGGAQTSLIEHYACQLATPTDLNLFIIHQPCRLIAARHAYSVPGGAACTSTIKKAADGTAIASGTAMTTAASLTGVGNTSRAYSLVTTEASLRCARFDRVGVDLGGTISPLTDLITAMLFIPLPDALNTQEKGLNVAGAAGDPLRRKFGLMAGAEWPVLDISQFINAPLASTAFYTCHTPLRLVAAEVSYAVQGTSPSIVIAKAGDGVALGSGVAMTSPRSLASSLETFRSLPMTLVATEASLRTAVGDRIGAIISGTIGVLSRVVITLRFMPVESELHRLIDV